MKKLTCEMCNSVDLIKKTDCMFVSTVGLNIQLKKQRK